MPNIPGAGEDDDPKVAPRPLDAPANQNRTTPQEFGAGVGGVLEQQSRSVDQVAQEYQARANAVADEAAFGRAQQLLNTKILDEKSGFLALKGQDAISQADKYTGDFQTGIAQIKDGLTPAQKQRMGYRLDRLQESGIRYAASHERQQHDVVADAAFRGSEQATIDEMSQLAGVPGSAPLIRQKMVDLISSARNRATYKYGQDAPPDAIKAEALPLLNKAAVEGMNEALASGDPKHARDVLEMMGPHLGAKAKFYTDATNRLLTQHAIAHDAENAIGQAVEHVTLPDGSDTIRIAPDRLNAALAKLPQTEHQGDVLKYVEQARAKYDDVWKKTVASVVSGAMKAGDPEALGNFQMSKVPTQMRTWLQQNDEEALVKLRGLETREDAAARAAANAEQRAERAEQQATSATNYNDAWRSLNDETNRPAILKQSRAQFATSLLDDKTYPGGISAPDRQKAMTEFDRIQKLGALSKNVVGTAVHDVLGEAFTDSGGSTQSTLFNKKYEGMLRDAAESFIAQNKGDVDEAKLRDHLRAEMTRGVVKDVVPGLFWGANDTDPMFRLEAEKKYGGSMFVGPDKVPVTLSASIPRYAAPGTPEEKAAQDAAAKAGQQQKPDSIAKARSMLSAGETLVKDPKGGLHALGAGEKMPDGWSEVK